MWTTFSLVLVVLTLAVSDAKIYRSDNKRTRRAATPEDIKAVVSSWEGLYADPTALGGMIMMYFLRECQCIDMFPKFVGMQVDDKLKESKAMKLHGRMVSQNVNTILHGLQAGNPEIGGKVKALMSQHKKKHGVNAEHCEQLINGLKKLLHEPSTGLNSDQKKSWDNVLADLLALMKAGIEEK